MNIDTIWQNALDEKLWSGAVVHAGNSEGVLFRRSCGMACPDASISMQDDSIFDISSITQAVGTATLAAMLYGRGQLDIDASFTRYLPEYRGILPMPVTVRDLALHISGFHNGKPYQKVKVEHLMRQAVIETSPAEPPEQNYTYACINYLLLGYIIEAVAGTSLAEFASEELFKPLDMRDTVWGKTVSTNPPRFVKMINPVGNTGIFSTANDLDCFCRMMLNNGNGLLTPDAYEELTTDSMPPTIGHPHAFGWDMAKEFRPNGLSAATIYHSGDTGQTIWIDLAKQLYVIVLTNRTRNCIEAKKSRTQLAETILSGIL
ncbi:MAG: serine hydrolase domain-containing protein [Victivallaceae bacterium]